jgi:predicted ester cyclase
MTRDEILALFERRQRAYDALDAAALARDYTDDTVIESPWAGVHKGPHHGERALKAVFSALQDLKMHTDRYVVDGDSVAQFLSIEGHNIGGYMGLPPTGKPFRLPAVFLYELRDGRIVRERRIYDFTGLLVQVGVLKAKPT